VVHIQRYGAAFDFHCIVEGIRVIFFEEQIFVVIAQGFIEPAFPCKKIKNPVHLNPLVLYIFEGKFCKIFNIAIEHQGPAVFKIVIFEDGYKNFPVGLEIVPLAHAHVKIADDEDFAALGNVQYCRRVKPGTDDIGEKRICHP
jgi:hypothetical protein